MNIQIDPSRRRVTCPYFHQHWHEPHLWMDFPTVKSNVSQLKHLKLVKFLGFTINGEDALFSSLVDLLQEKTIVLKSMTVKSHENVSWGIMKVPVKQPMQKWWNYRRRTAISSPRNFSFALIEDRWIFVYEKGNLKQVICIYLPSSPKWSCVQFVFLLFLQPLYGKVSIKLIISLPVSSGEVNTKELASWDVNNLKCRNGTTKLFFS